MCFSLNFPLIDILVTTPNRLVYLLTKDPPQINLDRYVKRILTSRNILTYFFHLSPIQFSKNFEVFLLLLLL